MAETTAIAEPTIAWTAKPLELPLYDQWMACADIHAPSYSPRMLDRLVRVARKKKVTTLVIGGDLTDQATISQWPNTLPQQSLEACLDSAGTVLSYLSSTFDRIVILPGNHDDRVAKKLGTYFSFDRLIRSCIGSRRMDAEIITTDHTFVYLGQESNDGRDAGVVFGHPAFYSSTPAKGMGDVAEMEHRHGLSSHNHLLGMQITRSSRYWAIDPGCMCEAENTPYIQRGKGISKFSRWKQGFVYLKRNIPTIMADGLVDWDDWGAS